MDNAIQKVSAFYGKQIVELNADPDAEEFEESFSKLTFRNMFEIALKLPDKFLNLTYGELIEMALRSDEEVDAFMEEVFDSIDEEQYITLEALFKTFFGE